MARYSITDINAEAAQHGLELVKGAGYFYWSHQDHSDIPSVYVAHFSHLDKVRWLVELADATAHVEQ